MNSQENVMNKMVSLAAFAVMASLSATASAAPNGCAGAGAQVTVAADNTKFARNGFVGKCSNNVLLQYSQNNTAFGVVAGSQKGKSYFGGGSNGGGIKYINNCASTGCTDTTEITSGNSDTQMNAS